MKRHISQELLDWKGSRDRKPLLLEGARQVGKTHILQKFAHEHFRAFHYMNFEEQSSVHIAFSGDLSPETIVAELELVLEKKIDVYNDLLIFDEVQTCPRALTSLKYFQEKAPHIAICAAGSLLGVALGEESFPVGKVTTKTLYPLNFEEFLQGVEQPTVLKALIDNSRGQWPTPGQHQKLWEYFRHYLITGGLPEVVVLYRENIQKLGPHETFNRVRKLQKEIIQNYLRDIAKHSGKTNAMHIERVLTNIPQQLAREISGSKNKFIFKGVIPGKSRYRNLVGPIDWLCKANLAVRCSIIETPEIPLSAYKTENRLKLYIFDVGILSALSDLSPLHILRYDFGSYKGYVAENFVAQELLSYGISQLFSWEGRTAEIEFLLEGQENIAIPIEVKSGNNTRSKSLSTYQEKYRPKISFLLLGKINQQRKNRGKTEHHPLYSVARLLKELA